MNEKATLDECREILENLVRIDSCQPEGNEEKVVDSILRMLPENLVYQKIVHAPNRASLLVKVEGQTDQGGIAFIGHIDTVACNDLDRWAYPPHEAVVKGDLLYGRGSSDMKGGVAAMLLTLKWLLKCQRKPKKPVYFCFTADEEKSGTGILAMVEGKYLEHIEEAVICEPSDEKIGICEKGALWLRVIIQGKASHASRPELGVNAVEYAIGFSNQLKEMVKGDAAHPILGSTTVSVTRFQGGIMTNIIPSNAKMELDIRTVPGVSHDKIIQTAQNICIDTMQKYPSVQMEIQVLNNRPALETPPESGFVKRVMEIAAKVGISTGPKGLYFYTDASQMIPHIPVPFVIAGPGDDALAHCVNEHISLSSVERYAQLYCCYISEYFT